MPTAVDKTKVKPRLKQPKQISDYEKNELNLLLPHHSLEPSENPELERFTTRIEMMLFLPYFLGLFLFLALTGGNTLFLFFWFLFSLTVFGIISAASGMLDFIFRDEV